MEKRKNPDKDLRKLSGLFFQVGLLAALMLAVCAFEYRVPKVMDPVDIPTVNVLADEIIPITNINPPPRPPKPKPIIIDPVVEHAEPEPVKFEYTLEPEALDIIPESIPDPQPIETAPEYHDYVEMMPAPKGGMVAFYEFIRDNMRYPSRARQLNIEGKVYVQFVIDENGKISQIKVIKGAGAGLDEEAERVLSIAPDWIPGRQGGRRVKVRMTMPIQFQLSK